MPNFRLCPAPSLRPHLEGLPLSDNTKDFTLFTSHLLERRRRREFTAPIWREVHFTLRPASSTPPLRFTSFAPFVDSPITSTMRFVLRSPSLQSPSPHFHRRSAGAEASCGVPCQVGGFTPWTSPQTFHPRLSPHFLLSFVFHLRQYHAAPLLRRLQISSTQTSNFDLSFDIFQSQRWRSSPTQIFSFNNLNL